MSNPFIRWAAERLDYGTSCDIVNQFFKMAAFMGIPQDPTKREQFREKLQQERAILEQLLGKSFGTSINTDDYFDLYDKNAPQCLHYVDRSIDNKQLLISGIYYPWQTPYESYVQHRFTSVLSYDEAVAEVKSYLDDPMSRRYQPQLLEVLEQLKTLRESMERLARLVSNGAGSKEDKDEAKELFKRFFDVFAYEVVFSAPI